jgi:hypothetical protein
VNPLTCQLITPPNPRYPNLNNNTRHTITFNTTLGRYEAGEPNRGGNYLSFEDVTAYLDWAALRPITELEYEKATRGTLPVLAGQWAWGSKAASNLTNVLTLNGPENGTETVNTPANANIRLGNTPLGGVAPGQEWGPVGCGIFARNNTPTRTTTGAAYWGGMEWSGNVAELVISIFATTYTGQWGNGMLNATNEADAANWPTGATANQYGWRGGGWTDPADRARISDREQVQYNWWGPTDRLSERGGRGAR